MKAGLASYMGNIISNINRQMSPSWEVKDILFHSLWGDRGLDFPLTTEAELKFLLKLQVSSYLCSK